MEIKALGLPLRRHGSFLATAAACLLVFTWFVTDGTYEFFRPEMFGTFYEAQARSLLHGHWDVPRSSLSDEAFIYQGKSYGYFGPTPALMRLPLLLTSLGEGQFSKLLLTLDFVLCLLGAYGLLCRAVRWFGSERPSPAAVTMLTANVGLGSTLFFLGSRAYVYHEAILCGATFALLAGYFTLVYAQTARLSAFFAALISGVLSIHSRPTSGLFALTFAGTVALLQAIRAMPECRLRHLGAAALCGVGAASFGLVSYLKFHTTEGMPLQYNVQYTPARLERMGGKPLSTHNLLFNLRGYFFNRGVEFRPSFPFVFYLGHDAANYQGYLNDVHYVAQPTEVLKSIRMDMTEPMAGPLSAMTGLSLLAMLGLLGAGLAAPAARGTILALALSALPFTTLLLLAAVVSHRYTADFCPLLIIAAAFGVSFLFARPGRVVWKIFLTVVTGWSIVVTLALTLHFQGREVWGVPDFVHQRYEAIRRRVDGAIASPTR